MRKKNILFNFVICLFYPVLAVNLDICRVRLVSHFTKFMSLCAVFRHPQNAFSLSLYFILFCFIFSVIFHSSQKTVRKTHLFLKVSLI